MEPSSETPRNRIEDVADFGMDAIAQLLETRGLELRYALVLVVADGTEEGERDAVTAGYGFEDAGEMLAYVFGHFQSTAEQLGMKVMIAPLGEG